jgi:3D (Asp-Asp-Asp) domain-containing protein
MLYRLFILIQIIYSGAFFLRNYLDTPGEVLAASVGEGDALEGRISYEPKIVTTTAFDQKEAKEYEYIPFNVVYENDDELEYGKEEITTPGQDGVITSTYLVTYWTDDIIDKTLLDEQRKSPTDQIVSKGTKIVWKTLNTPEYGKITYWYKLRVWATKYDSSCEGCSYTTALGAPVQQGVCAVDPSVIDMYTHFYVPGYGKCQALDVGGAIKGNKIDLAYEDHTEGSWRTGYTDIYLMDNEP